MFRTLSFAATACASLFLACLLAPVTASAQSVTLNWGSCPGGYTLSPASGNTQTLTCLTGGSGPPTGCAVSGPTTASVGQNTSLSVACSGGAPLTSWAWTGGNCAGVTTATCSATESVAGVQRTYGVTVGNGNAPNATATPWTVTWVAGGSAPSGCSLSGTAVGATGGQTTLIASCNGGGAPTSFAWTANPAPSAGFASTTSTGTQSPTITSSTTFTVTPSNGNGSGNQASVTVTVSGGGGTINCATNALGTPVSGGTQVLDMDWNNPTQLHTASLGQNDAVVVRFTTPNTGATLYAKMSGAEFGGNTAGRFATLSSSACDFRQPPPFSWAGTSYGTSVEILFSVNANPWGYAPLLPGTTYYFNVQTTGSCANCNMFFQMNKY